MLKGVYWHFTPNFPVLITHAQHDDIPITQRYTRPKRLIMLPPHSKATFLFLFTLQFSDFPINHRTTSGILVFRPRHILFFNQSTGACANIQFKLIYFIYFTSKNKFSQLILILLDGFWEGHEKNIAPDGDRTHSLQIQSHVLYHCTTAPLYNVSVYGV